MNRTRFLGALLAGFGGFLLLSGLHPKDRVVWLLEVAPALLGVGLLVATWRRFPFTTLVSLFVFAHSLILLLGGHYTYAEVPLGYWARDLFGLARNHYDRIGHLAQGFFPALVIREILLRCSPLRPGKWLFFIVVCICLAFSAGYELLEWWTALLATPGQGAAFLGTQGDVWDTQWDMFLCLVGAVAAQLLFSRYHDRQLARLPGAVDPAAARCYNAAENDR